MNRHKRKDVMVMTHTPEEPREYRGMSIEDERRIRAEHDARVAELREAFGTDAVEASLEIRVQRSRPSDRPRCGARTRAGGTCQAPVYWRKGDLRPRKRCRMHGNSDGPKTAEGRRRIGEAASRSNREKPRRKKKVAETGDGGAPPAAGAGVPPSS